MSANCALDGVGAAEIASARARVPAAFAVVTRRRAVALVLWALAVAWFVSLLIRFDVLRAFADLGRVWVVLRLMVDWSGFAGWDHAAILRSMAETVAMAFLGTLMGAVAAVPLGFLGARTVVAGRVVRFLARRAFDVFRGLDQLIWALVFVRAMGLGPVAGILAIFVADLGTLAKLYSEAVEAVDRGQVDGVRSTGAGRLSVIRFGMLPQVLPVMASQALYQFESNTREATILGLVGAGGIGLRLSERIQINAWDQVAYIVVLILLTVAAIDAVSARIRGGLTGRRRQATTRVSISGTAVRSAAVRRWAAARWRSRRRGPGPG